jgi:hypothetical protein
VVHPRDESGAAGDNAAATRSQNLQRIERLHQHHCTADNTPHATALQHSPEKDTTQHACGDVHAHYATSRKKKLLIR